MAFSVRLSFLPLDTFLTLNEHPLVCFMYELSTYAIVHLEKQKIFREIVKRRHSTVVSNSNRFAGLLRLQSIS